MSDWSAWSKYDAAGVSYRFRQTLRPALNGGKECPDELIQLRKSKLYTKVMKYENNVVVHAIFVFLDSSRQLITWQKSG